MSMVSIGASCKTKHEHHRTKELCKKDVTPPQPFLDVVHLFALDLEPDFRSCDCLFDLLDDIVFIAFSMCENELLNHRNSFIEGNLSERSIETCSVCLRLFVNVFPFFALNSLEDVESKRFIPRLSVERVVALSSAAHNVRHSPRRRPQRPTGPGKSRLRPNAAARRGTQRPHSGGGAFAEQRRRGGRQGQRWPGASEAGPRKIEAPLWHFGEFSEP